MSLFDDLTVAAITGTQCNVTKEQAAVLVDLINAALWARGYHHRFTMDGQNLEGQALLKSALDRVRK